MNKYFIITVDTEGDNLWDWKPGREIKTNNYKFVSRFQNLCEKYNFKPVYLTNYEMANNENWVNYSKKKAIEEKCEIGLHLHAWNTPPEYLLTNNFNGNPYITEYPSNIVDAKVKFMISLLKEKYGIDIVSHRSGRWATSDTYLSILKKYGIKVDCSFTPKIDLSKIPGCSKNCGNDYRNAILSPHFLNSNILEVPMTTFKLHYTDKGTFKQKIKCLIFGKEMWLRPAVCSYLEMKVLIDKLSKKTNHIELMMHSSELMPGGSPYLKNELDIDTMYKNLEMIFSYVTKKGYKGVTLGEFYKYELYKNVNK